MTSYGFVFYWWYYPIHLLLILALTSIVYVGALWIQASRLRGESDRAVFVVFCGGALAVLAYYKYLGFVWNSLATWAGFVGIALEIPELEYQPPLAISFFIFEFVHYLIEVHRGTIRVESFRRFLLFIMFFPTLVCGPIKRYGEFEGQVDTREFDSREALSGVERIIVGLGKKFILADPLGAFCLPILADLSGVPVASMWLAAYAYAFHIYLDFAGYSDIAIGSAQVFGFHVPENFDNPYLQPNVGRFWRSWHMSLTSWITDYVYIPLGGSRRGETRAYWNRLGAMTLCGLWHGPAFHFVVWGAVHGMGLHVYRWYQTLRERGVFAWKLPHPIGQALATVGTFHFVVLCWMYFVLDAPEATWMIGRMLGILGS